MEQFDIAGLQARDITASFVMAINGAFFFCRKPDICALPLDLALAKNNIRTASYIFINSLNKIIYIYDSGKDTQVTQDKLNNIAVQLIQKGNHAVKTGIGNGAATLIGNTAYGAFSQLVGRAANTLDLSVKDTSGRTWKDPSKLVQTIVRDFIYQREVEARIQRLREIGEQFFMVGQEDYSLVMFEQLRSQLFHPNSSKLPEQFNVQTQP